MVGPGLTTLFAFGIKKVAGPSSTAAPAGTPAQPSSPPVTAGSATTTPAAPAGKKLCSSAEAVRN